MPTKRADQILRLIIDGEIHIGNIEFQTSYEDKLLARLLVYHAVLYYDYDVPVYSLLIYPFKTRIDEPPLKLFSAGKDRVIFHYEYLKLYDLNAEQYVRDKSFCMYPLLPAMQGVDHRLLKQAMDELTTLYTGDETSLADRYLWMQVLIARSDTIDLEERYRIQQELHMYDPLLENHPKVKRIRAEGEARGIAKGLAEGEARGIAKGSKPKES